MYEKSTVIIKLKGDSLNTFSHKVRNSTRNCAPTISVQLHPRSASW